MPGIVGETPDTFIVDYQGQQVPIMKSQLSPEMLSNLSAQAPQQNPQLPGPYDPATAGPAVPPTPPEPQPLTAAEMATLPPVPRGMVAPSMPLNIGMQSAPLPNIEGLKKESADKAAPAPATATPPNIVYAPQQASGPPSGPVGAAQSAMTGQTGGGGPDKSQKLLEQGLATGTSAINAARDAGVARADAEAAYQDKANTNLQGLYSKQMEAEGAYQRSRQEQMDKYQKLTADLNAAPAAVDPNHYWNSQATWQKVLAGIGLGLSGLNGSTAGVQIIQHAITQDIAAQQANIDNTRAGKKAAVDAQGNLLGMMHQNFGDDMQAQAGARAFLSDITANQLKSIADKSKSAEVKANALDMLGKLQMGAAGDMSTFGQRRDEQANRAKMLVLERDKVGIENQRLQLDIAKANGKGAQQPFSSQPSADRLKAAAKDSVAHPQNFDAAVNGFSMAAAIDMSRGKPPRPAMIEMIKDMVKSRWKSTGSIDEAINSVSRVLREARGSAVAGGEAPGDESP